MATTMTISGAAIISAGKNVSASVPATSWDHWIEQAEAILCILTKYDLITNWGTLNAVYKLIFQEYCELNTAIKGIEYDMSGYTSRVEAEDIINTYIYKLNQIEKLLEKDGVQDFLGVNS